MENKKQFIWADLKKIVNEIPEEHLNSEVRIWTDDERGYRINEVEIAKEDYVYHEDYPEEGSCPKSEIDIEEGEEEFYKVSVKKGERIIYAD